jgi:hypothetical protein
MGAFGPNLWEVLRYEHDAGDGMRIGLDDYPIHDEANRLVLNQLIIDEYYEREIGLETVPLFMRRLRLKMRQIMPYYNKLFATEDLLIGKELATFDLTTNRNDSSTDTNANNAKGNSEVVSTSGARNVNSDTPAVLLRGNGDYATSAADATSTATSTTTSEQDTSGSTLSKLEALSHTSGFQGAASTLLNNYRATLLNINMMIVPEVNELFMLVRGDGREIMPSYDLSRPLPMLGGIL